VRNEYVTALKTLADMSTWCESVVITGQRGAGMLFLLFVIALLGAYKYFKPRKVLLSILHPLAPLVQRKAHSTSDFQLYPRF
jgi:hypothetical protein